MDLHRLRERAVELLSGLIRIDTTNPPGNELECARFLAGWLNDHGLPGRVYETEPGRGGTEALLPGDRDAAPIMLMGHLDVVPVGDREAWTRDPFGGEVVDGCVWGRGAIDCKGVLAAQAAALVELARNGETTGRPVRLLAAPDEEVGGAAGVGWLTKHRRELVDCWCCVTEGGGEYYRLGERGVATFMVGEKGQLRLDFTIRGRQGHAAMPGDEQAVYILGELLTRLRKRPEVYRVLDVNVELLGLLTAGRPDGEALTAALESGDAAAWRELFAVLAAGAPEIVDALRAAYTDTLAPTIVRGGEKINIIPGRVALSCDCRLLPGSEPEALLAELRSLAADLPVEIEVSSSHPASVSDIAHPVVEVARRLVARWEPQSAFLPFLCPAGTDSRHLRWAGIDSYGYVPYPADPLPADFNHRMHAVDERLEVAILERITARYLELVRELRKH
jgi:acetylornithine deacetylase/succinyl-diaminopimelate desuccinylase-like protein